MRKAVFAAALFATCSSVVANSTIDPAAAYTWGGNVGELNWLPSVADGVVTGEYVCSGMIWSANSGWINLGSGAPANGIRYANTSGEDFGVNLLADGSLRGLAWSANVGWVNFEATGDPRIDFTTGNITGYAWGANVGWLTLSGGGDHGLVTQSIPAGADADSDGLTDAWELERAGNLTTFTLDGDADGDGITDLGEYLNGTDPTSPGSALRITEFSTNSDGTSSLLTWTSTPARFYSIETTTDLVAVPFTLDPNFGAPFAPDPGTQTTRSLTAAPGAKRFYRVRAIRPLAP